MLAAVSFALTAAAFATVGCDDGHVADQKALAFAKPDEARIARLDVEPRYCTEIQPRNVAVDVSHVYPVPGASPSLIVTDLDPTNAGRLWVVDADAYEIALIDADATVLRTFGRKGGGPGELAGKPIAIASKDSVVYVADDHGFVTAFDTAGNYKTKRRILRHLSDIAVSTSGDVYAVADVLVNRVLGRTRSTSAPDGNVPYAVRAAAMLEGAIDTILVYDSTSVQSRPMAAALINHVRVTAGNDDEVAVFFPWDKYVILLKDGKKIGSIAGCYPPEIERAYARQREALYQSAFRVTQAVSPLPNGEIAVLAKNGHFRSALFRYQRDGKLVDVVEYRLGKDSLHSSSTAAFLDAATVIMWQPKHGHVDRLTVKQAY